MPTDDAGILRTANALRSAIMASRMAAGVRGRGRDVAADAIQVLY